MDKENTLKKYCPKRIKIVPDDYHSKFVGTTADLKQFFITTPFTSFHPETKKSCEFIAVFIWEKDGSFKEASIDNLGPRDQLNNEERKKIFINRIKELGKIKQSTIEIEPFQVERFDLTFGLIYSRSEINGHKHETVELHPGNFMAFYPPWEGDYDT
jgi:hypothetical protein